jgi:hypothetical protein
VARQVNAAPFATFATKLGIAIATRLRTMMPNDQFLKIARELWTSPRALTPLKIAEAFRDHFAQQTCLNCQHNVDVEVLIDYDTIATCAKGVHTRGASNVATFGCSLFTAKDR